jgi:uncharacterized membrane protein HdeD (DUF308 family)
MVLEKTRDKWWGRMAFGIIALIFGLAFLLVPDITLVLFLYLFGFFMILSGIVLLGFSRYRVGTHRTLNIAEGIINIIIGVVAFLAPGFTALTAIYIVAIFAIISGLLQIGESLVASRGTTSFGASNRWILFISGAFSLLIGVLIVLFPGAGILALLWIIGIFLIVVGIINIISGIRARNAITSTAAAK